MAAGRTWDDVIVGAGAAGCVLASRLAARGDRSVLLLEAGPDRRADTPHGWHDGWDLGTFPDWGFASEATNERPSTTLRRGRLLGGTSWLTRFAVRGAAADFDRWAELGNPGWAFADVLPAFRRLEADAEFGDRPWHGADGPIPITRYPELERTPIHRAALEAAVASGFDAVDDHNAPDAIGVGPFPMSARAGHRVTTLDGYLGSGVPSDGLEIRTDALVDRVELEAGRAVAVRLADGQRIAAEAIVLAAGTYASPTILQRSGIGPGELLAELGIPVAVDLPGVGANLADHPAVEVDSGWQGPAATGPVLHSMATFRSRTAGASPDLMLWIPDPTDDDSRLYLDAVLLKPDGRGSVRIRSSDASAAPSIRLPERTASDHARLADGVERAVDIARRPELRRHIPGAAPTAPATPDEWAHRLRGDLYSIPHVVGTCAMGPRPGEGAVVDATGRVHGVAGLFVVDASIIPEPPSGFPHVITIMLAERLTERSDAFR
jgi:choline dehydrogenase